jgi:hypothetical protein
MIHYHPAWLIGQNATTTTAPTLGRPLGGLALGNEALQMKKRQITDAAEIAALDALLAEGLRRAAGSPAAAFSPSGVKSFRRRPLETPRFTGTFAISA